MHKNTVIKKQWGTILHKEIRKLQLNNDAIMASRI